MKLSPIPGRPWLLDLFCGGGGAAMGYYRAGFNVVGIDNVHQPDYPFMFVQANWSDMDPSMFDVVHASPPCQGYSKTLHAMPGAKNRYPRMLTGVRTWLKATRKPYIIENVEGAPLVDPIMLCGEMFGLNTYRHRLFESNVELTEPEHPLHVVPSNQAGKWTPGTRMSVAGNCAPITEARRALDIAWMKRSALMQAIPPAYTEWIGRQVIATLDTSNLSSRNFKTNRAVRLATRTTTKGA